MVGSRAMLDVLINNTFVASFVSALMVADLFVGYRWIRAKRRRQDRELIIVDQNKKPVAGCRLYNPKYRTYTEDKTENRGRISFPNNWPNKTDIQITNNGRVIHSTQVNFKNGSSVKIDVTINRKKLI